MKQRDIDKKAHINNIIMAQSDLPIAINKAKKLMEYLNSNKLKVLDTIRILSKPTDELCCVGVMYQCERVIQQSEWDK